MPSPPQITPRLASAPASDENAPRYPWTFCTMSTPAIRALARRIRTATALRLFLTLPDILDWHEWRHLNQIQLGEELGTAQSNISAALKQLLEIGVLQRKGSGPRQEWRLSLDLGWRGNVADFAKEAAAQGKSFPKRLRGQPKQMSQNDYPGAANDNRRTTT